MTVIFLAIFGERRLRVQLELIEMIFLSEKRKQLLLFLREGPKNMDEITKTLQVTPTAILPQIKKLKEKFLVVQEDKNYALSPIGKVLVEKMEPLVDVIDVFEKNFEYWSERDLQGIPSEFRKRIGELGKCKLIQPDLDRMFEIDPEIVENLFKSEEVYEFIAYFHPSLIRLCQELAKEKVEVSFLMAKPVFERYSQDYAQDFQNLLTHKNLKFFVYSGELKISNLIVTDKFFLLSLFPKNPRHFDMDSLISYEPSAIKFGKELIEKLLENSNPIIQIPSE